MERRFWFLFSEMEVQPVFLVATLPLCVLMFSELSLCQEAQVSNNLYLTDTSCCVSSLYLNAFATERQRRQNSSLRVLLNDLRKPEGVLVATGACCVAIPTISKEMYFKNLH